MNDPRSICAVELGALSASGGRRVPLAKGTWRWHAILDSCEDASLVSMLYFAMLSPQPVCPGIYVLGELRLAYFVCVLF